MSAAVVGSEGAAALPRILAAVPLRANPALPVPPSPPGMPPVPPAPGPDPLPPRPEPGSPKPPPQPDTVPDLDK
jgi:hypothetical protein